MADELEELFLNGFQGGLADHWYKSLFEASPGLYLILDTRLHIVAVTDNYLKATMTVREQILYRHIFEVFPDNPHDENADGVRNLKRSLETVLATGQEHIMAIQRYDIRTADDPEEFEVRYWSPVNTPVKDDSGRVALIIHKVEDVTATVRLQESHDERFVSYQRLQAILEAMPDGMVVTNAQGQMILVNATAAALFGYQKSEMLYRDVSMLVPPRFREHHGKNVVKYFEAPRTRRMGYGQEMFGLKKDGTEFPFHVTLSPLDTPEGLLTNAVVRDLTETKKLEEKLFRARRIESVGTFAGHIAHDLNNALAPVVMSLELLKRMHPDSMELISGIEASALRGADMLRQLLVFSQGAYVEPQRVQPAEILRELKQLLHASLPENIKLSASCEKDILPMRADPTQIQQVLMNLCTNAKDAMKEGGKLTISAENVELTSEAPQLMPHMRPGRYVVWQVSDTGPGMEQEILDRIFEPFFTTKPIGKGTGLGLSIVSGIVRAHGGFVHAYSAVGRGRPLTSISRWIRAALQSFVVPTRPSQNSAAADAMCWLWTILQAFGLPPR